MSGIKIGFQFCPQLGNTVTTQDRAENGVQKPCEEVGRKFNEIELTRNSIQLQYGPEWDIGPRKELLQ